jgi:hypothetical protein
MMTEREIFLEALEMSWEEIAAAEAKDPPAPGYGGQGKTGVKQP